jgi:CheY-like chemotaxis protein
MLALHILVVEDEPDIAELMVHLLGDEGYTVRHAPNGLIALTMLASAQVDLIVTDIMMPDMGGVELIEAVRATPELQRIPILVVTALPHEYVQSRCSAVEAVIQKPFRIRQFVTQVGDLLGSRCQPSCRWATDQPV